MSDSRAALLEQLQSQAEPTTLAALARLSGLHVNTVREHLDALIGEGWVRRLPGKALGRGRPALRYEATGESPQASEYAGLAAALASAIRWTSERPAEDAEVAGLEWGRQLARRRDNPPVEDAAAARREVVALLDEIGFAPRADSRDRTVRLTRCPLLETAHRYPDVVCAVHLGLAKGALEEYGEDPGGTRLEPFAEPGACLLHLREQQ